MAESFFRGTIVTNLRLATPYTRSRFQNTEEDEQMIRVSESKLHSAWWALRLSFGLVPLLAGLDKFFNILTDWTQYESPILQQVLPFSTTTFMHVAGVT